MPNWCTTTIKFTGGFDDVTDLRDRIVKYTSKESLSRLSQLQLSNIIIGFGLGDPDTDTGTYEMSRGHIVSIGDVYPSDNDEDSSFYILTDTEWVPRLKMWSMIIDQEYPNEETGSKRIRITYCATEWSKDLYVTNDFAEWGNRLYNYDFEDEENDTYAFDYADSEEALVEKMNELLEPRHITVNSYHDILDIMYRNDVVNVNVLKLKYADIDAFA